MQHNIEKLLLDIRICCEEIISFTGPHDFESYLTDRMLQLALEREFEIIGEALNRLEQIDMERLTCKIPDYRKIIGFRNLVAHGYDIINDSALWDLVENHVPKLLILVNNY